MNITALAGGVGGAKLVEGLVNYLSPDQLSIVVNTGDDFSHFGLKISPDLDTIFYTLAGLSNPSTGWGRNDENWIVYNELIKYSAPAWFHLGDKDLALHLERTRRLNEKQELSQVTNDFCKILGIPYKIFPMTNNSVGTTISTEEFGDLPFQEFFVKYNCQPKVKGIKFKGINKAKPTPGLLETLENSDAIIICPSNPFVSIDPILKIKGVKQIIKSKKCVAVSPIINGKAIKGPAAKMFSELGFTPSVLSVAKHYLGILSGIVIDKIDQEYVDQIKKLQMEVFATNILMFTPDDKKNVAFEVLNFLRAID